MLLYIPNRTFLVNFGRINTSIEFCGAIVRILFGEVVLPHMGHIGMCGPKGYAFSAVLIINRVSILAILVLNRASILRASLEFGVLFRRSEYFSS